MNTTPETTTEVAERPRTQAGLARVGVRSTGAGATVAGPVGVALPDTGAYDHVPTRFQIGAQRFWGWLTILPFCGILALVFRFVGRYRIENMRELRAQYRELTRDGRPLLICLNHLTYIDSALLIWALASNVWYQAHYSKFSWNLPAGDHFKRKLHHRLVAYLAKCLYIHRDGTKRHKNGVLAECMRLLGRGEVVTIFPEGKRSRTGRFELDRLTYGVGKVCAEVTGCRVLCAYVRGDRQESFSSYPARGSRFRVATSVLEPRTELTGREACAELTMQIAREIKRLENQHFADRLASARADGATPA